MLMWEDYCVTCKRDEGMHVGHQRFLACQLWTLNRACRPSEMVCGQCNHRGTWPLPLSVHRTVPGLPAGRSRVGLAKHRHRHGQVDWDHGWAGLLTFRHCCRGMYVFGEPR
jgi:hypothetical protein